MSSVNDKNELFKITENKLETWYRFAEFIRMMREGNNEGQN